MARIDQRVSTKKDEANDPPSARHTCRRHGDRHLERIRLAVQRTGTLSWELDVLKARGLDKKADLQIEALELATPEAGKIAIKGGSADMFLSDWLYVTRGRALGDALVFYPSSSTVGAVMVPAASPIKDVGDL